MNAKQRLRKAFDHQEPDRIPIFELSIDSRPASAIVGREMWVGNLGSNAVRSNRMESAGAVGEFAKRVCNDTVELWSALGLDMLVIPRPARREGMEIKTLGDHHWRSTDLLTGYWEDFIYTPQSEAYSQVRSSLDGASIADFEAYISALEQVDYRVTDYDLATLERWVNKTQEFFVLMAADVDYPPASKSWAGLFMECLILRPDLIDRYLDVQMLPRLLLIDEALKRGVDGILAGNDWASATGPMISPKHMRRYIVPRFRQISAACHKYSKVIVKHTDGNIRPLESILFDECELDGWHPVDPTVGLTMEEYKKKIGDRLTLIGNVNCATTLVYGTRAEVVAETKEVIRAGAPGGGFVISSSNSIHPHVNPDLYLTMLETIREYGAYPVNLTTTKE